MQWSNTLGAWAVAQLLKSKRLTAADLPSNRVATRGEVGRKTRAISLVCVKMKIDVEQRYRETRIN